LVRQPKTAVFLGRNLGTNISYVGSQSVDTQKMLFVLLLSTLISRLTFALMKTMMKTGWCQQWAQQQTTW